MKAVDVLSKMITYAVISVLEAFVFVEMMNSNRTLAFAALHLETVQGNVRYNKT